MAMGTCWADGSWTTTSWLDGTWEGDPVAVGGGVFAALHDENVDVVGTPVLSTQLHDEDLTEDGLE
jgi:hypothetical protein